MSVRFELERAGMRYGASPVLADVTLEIRGPGLVAVVGPNGAGKSTLLGILGGLRPGHEGTCRLDGKPVEAWPRKQFARRVSLAPQSLRLDFPFTAEQVALMGRTPHAGGLFDAEADVAAAEEALRRTDAWAFRQRDFRSLSGGERQRVVLAAALAQAPEALLLDEPTTFLDIEHQLAIYGLLAGLAREGMLVVAVTHDLNLAARFATRVIALRQGRVMADGPPREALNEERIAEVFRVRARTLADADGSTWIAYGG